MHREKKLIPELRFPEFDGEWNMEDLEKCLDYLQPTPYLVESTNYKNEYETPVLTAGKSFVLGYTDEKEGIFKDELPVIIFDDFTTASKYVDFPFKVKSSAMKILLAKDNANIKFVYESMQNLRFEVGVHKRHWISVFSQLQIPVPNPKEQQEIAACLSSLDEVIQAHSQKLEQLKDHKKGLMQNLFPQDGEKVPKFRFAEFEKDGEWVEKSIDSIAKVSAGGTPTSTVSKYWGGNISWMNSGELNLKKVYSVQNSITDLGLKESSTKVIPPLCVLIGLAGQGKTRGTAAINYIELCTNQSIAAIHPNPKQFDSEFLYFKIDSMYKTLRRLSTGQGGRGGLNLSIIREIKIHLPSIKEQQKIASCLSVLDELVTAEAEKIEQLEQHKKGLMQGLFPKIEH